MRDPDRMRVRVSLRTSEGFRSAAYQDSKGFWTIGYGRLIDARRGGGISQGEAEYMLANDVLSAEMACETMPAYLDLSPPRQAVLIEMCFNLGVDGLRKFKRMFSALVHQDYAHAAAEMLDSQWAADVKDRAVRLAEQMKTGQWQ